MDYFACFFITEHNFYQIIFVVSRGKNNIYRRNISHSIDLIKHWILPAMAYVESLGTKGAGNDHHIY